MVFINESWLDTLGISRDEFDVFWIILMIVGAFLAGLGISSSRKKKDWLNEAQKRQNAKYEYSDPVIKRKDIPQVGQKWNPDGWYYDEAKGKWTSPDYANAKANTNMPVYLTPEEKELAKQIHISRTEPSFEEWKAAREREQGKGE